MEATGSQKQVAPEPGDVSKVQRGSYSCIAPNGTTVFVVLIDGGNGFQATCAHLSVAPPMPDDVQKMLADLKAAGAL